MKICIVSPFAYGVNISPRLYQASLLAKKGHELFFVTPRQQYILQSMPKNHRSLITNYESVEMHYFNVAYPFSKLAYPFPNLLEEIRLLNSIIKKKKVDIIHFYQPEFLTSLPLPLIKTKFKKPILLNVCGFPGVSWFYGTSIVNIVGLNYTQTVVRALMGYSDKILLFASNLKMYARRLGAPEEKLIFLPQGIHLDLPRNIDEVRDMIRMELGISDDEKLITYTGRLAPVKGVSLLIKSFRKLYGEYHNCKLLIVGDGPYRELYEAQSGRLLNKSIFFTGFVKPEKVVHFLLASDIFVLPSLSEGIPSSLLEACFVGLPCIATEVGAIPDIIKNGETGITIKAGDCDQLFKSLVMLVTDEVTAVEMGKQAKIRIKNMFGWEKIINRYERICKELLIEGN